MLLETLQDDARASPYASWMASTQDQNREILATNIRGLMKRRSWKQTHLAKESKISQTHIGNILRKEVDPTTVMLDAIGNAFRLPGWVLLIPGLPIEILDSASIPELIKTYIDAARKPLTSLIAEREVSRTYPALPPPRKS